MKGKISTKLFKKMRDEGCGCECGCGCGRQPRAYFRPPTPSLYQGNFNVLVPKSNREMTRLSLGALYIAPHQPEINENFRTSPISLFIIFPL